MPGYDKHCMFLLLFSFNPSLLTLNMPKSQICTTTHKVHAVMSLAHLRVNIAIDYCFMHIQYTLTTYPKLLILSSPLFPVLVHSLRVRLKGVIKHITHYVPHHQSCSTSRNYGDQHLLSVGRALSTSLIPSLCPSFLHFPSISSHVLESLMFI